jgi:hypothetical protein
MELECLAELYRGEIEQALKTAEKVRKHAAAYFQNDLSLAVFLGNLAEFMYNKDKRFECVDVAKEGRSVVWLKLKDLGIDIDP